MGEKATIRKLYSAQDIAHRIKQPIKATWVQAMGTQIYLTQTRRSWEIRNAAKADVQKQEQLRIKQWEAIGSLLDNKTQEQDQGMETAEAPLKDYISTKPETAVNTRK